MCVCSLSYPACKARAPHCHLWPVRLYNIFPTLSHKQHDFREKVTEHEMCVLIFATVLSKIFLILRKVQRYIINVHISVFTYSVLYSRPILMKVGFSLQFFEKILKYQVFMKIHLVVSHVVPRGERDMTKLIVVFRSIAKNS